METFYISDNNIQNIKSLWGVIVLNLIYLKKFVPYVNVPFLGVKNGKIAGMKLNTVQNVAVVVVLRLKLINEKVSDILEAMVFFEKIAAIGFRIKLTEQKKKILAILVSG
jgi:hypothetical protein